MVFSLAKMDDLHKIGKRLFGERMQFENIDINRAEVFLNHPDCLFIDLREPDEFDAGHLPGAIRVPFEALLTGRIVPDEKKKIFVYCDTGLRSYEICQTLSQRGYTCVNLMGGYTAYRWRKG